MYQFSTTNVINSQYAVDYNGNPLKDISGNNVAKYSGSAAGLSVAKVGFFKKAGIVSIYKRPYQAGVKEVASITVPTLTSGAAARLIIDIKLSQSTQSEYTNYSLDFKLPVAVEILSSGNASTDAAAFITQLNTLKNRFGHSYVVAASGGGAVITLTAKEDVQRFNSIVISKETANSNSMTQVDYVTEATGSVTTPGKIGFGDDAWMLKAVMVPTAENVRVFGISKDERPIMGGNYSQYVLRYSIDKDGTDGIVSGGKSVTTHVFYVLNSLVSGFETEIGNIGLTVGLMNISAADVSLATATNDTSQIVVTGAIGAVTFSSDQPTRATVNSSGLVSTAGVTGTGAVVITATDSVGNTDTLNFTIT